MEVSIRIAGAAGQGIQTAAELLGKIVTRSGLWASCVNDAESRIRGGLNFSHLRLGDRPREGVSERIDGLLALTQRAVDELAGGLAADGVLVGPHDRPHPHRLAIDLEDLARQSGNPKTLAVVALGVCCGLLGLDRSLVEAAVRERFGSSPKLAEANHRAIQLGMDAGQAAAPDRFRMAQTSDSAHRLWLYGHEALSLGAVAGGVSFVAGYPMSPSTSILTDLSEWSRALGMVVLQAEDEIAAINMVAGASYAGARAMTATSGGGFCLMTEGVSLLGMIEQPAVIVIGQRPGPATGLPTRTAQNDLHLALHAGHGSFPRLILAPRDVSDGFEMGARAFDLAERFQIPVFVLTDQQLQDAQATVAPFETGSLPGKRHLADPSSLLEGQPYRRFALTPDGISPQLAPGASPHLVVVDSDEHDETGHMIESAALATAMAEKRIARERTLASAGWLFPPSLLDIGPDRPLVVSWGSSFVTLREAKEELAREGFAFGHLHLRQLWPLPRTELGHWLRQGSQLLVVENNPQGQLEHLLPRVTERKVNRAIRRLDGRPLTVEQLVRDLKENLR